MATIIFCIILTTGNLRQRFSNVETAGPGILILLDSAIIETNS